MSTQKAITIQLDEREYEQVEAAARRKGVSPDVLIRTYVREMVHEDVLSDPDRRKQALYDALDALDELAATMPPFDAERLVREGRDELEERSIF